MEALILRHPGTQIYIRTLAPRPIFAAAAGENLSYDPVGLDVGVVENDVLSQDIGATLQRWKGIFAENASLTSREVAFIIDKDVDVIISDIPPLASDIGAATATPTIAMSNFSWDFIYEAYATRYPAFQEVVHRLRASYEKTSLLLRLPLHHEMSAFPRQVDIPFVVRKAASRGDELRSRLGIPEAEDGRRIILIALRMDAQLASSAVRELSRSNHFTILSTDEIRTESDCDVHVVEPELTWSEFPSVVAMSDLVIGKLGYGLVAECIAGRTPLLSMPRRDFAEYDLLLDGCEGLLPVHVMPEHHFLTGRWHQHVDSLLAKEPSWLDVRLDGAEAAVDAIVSHAVGNHEVAPTYGYPSWPRPSSGIKSTSEATSSWPSPPQIRNGS